MNRDTNKEIEEDVYRRKWVNDWLHNYGLDIEDNLSAGDVEELCERMLEDRDKLVKEETAKEVADRIIKVLDDRLRETLIEKHLVLSQLKPKNKNENA
jgi:hypothetical protein